MSKWASLEDVQPIATKILTNSIKKNRISHAYLIQGLRGTGKESIAILLAQTLFCEERTGVEPCHTCSACKRILSKNHPDVHWIEKDGQSIKNDQIDLLRKEFAYSGVESERKIYIIKDAQTLTNQAANRILKFLEEPIIETTALLLTENAQTMIPTIRSRCQVIDLKPLNTKLFQEKLLDAGLTKQQSRLMSAITYNIEEAISLCQDDVYIKIIDVVEQFIEKIIIDYNNRFLFIHQVWLININNRELNQQALDLLLLGFKDIVYIKAGKKDSLVFFQETDKIFNDAIEHFSQPRLLQIMNALLEAKQKLKQNVHPTLVMEQFILQL